MYKAKQGKYIKELHQLPVAYLSVDSEGTIININPKAQQILQARKAEAGHNITQYLNSKESSYFLNNLSIVLEKGRLDNFCFDLKDGRQISFQASSFNGGVHGILQLSYNKRDYFNNENYSLQDILDRIETGIAIISHDEMMVNKALIMLTGISEPQLVLDYIPKWYASIKELEQKEINAFTCWVTHGTKGRIRLNVRRVFVTGLDQPINILMVEPFQQNVQEIKIHDREALYSNSFLNRMTKAAVVLDQNERIYAVNTAFFKLFGIESTFFTDSFDDLLAKSCPNHFNTGEFIELCDFMRAKDTYACNEYVCKKGGKIRIEYIQPTPQFSLWLFSTVKSEKKPENTIDHLKYANLINNSSLGWVELNEVAEIVLVNKVGCGMLNKPKSELLRTNFFDLVQNTKALDEEVLQVDYSGSFEVEIETSPQNKKVFTLTKAPRLNKNGSVNGSLLILFDVTKLHKLIKKKRELLLKLKERNIKVMEYTQIVSHDLKTPLQNIYSLTEWMQEDYAAKLGEEGSGTLQLIKDKVRRINRLITGVLKYSQLSNIAVNPEPIQLNDLVTRLFNDIEKKEHIQLKLVDKLPEIKADKNRIKQIFQILILNAINHMDKAEGLIEIGVTKKSNYLRFFVRDNGIGISEAMCKKIFSIYESQNKVGSSTGLGLAIVKKIVQQLHGRVWVESEVGEGTIFFIELPCQSPNFKCLST